MKLRIKDNSVANGIARECLDFCEGGMKLTGEPWQDDFNITVLFPHRHDLFSTEVKVVHRDSSYFGVKFVNPPQELINEIQMWE